MLAESLSLCWLSSNCDEQGLVSSCGAPASPGVASFVAEHGLWGMQASVVDSHGL